MESASESADPPFSFLLHVALRLELDVGGAFMWCAYHCVPSMGRSSDKCCLLGRCVQNRLENGPWKGKKRITPNEEVAKCFVEATLGLKAKDLKSNALKWKLAAEAAVADGGSSDKNMQTFIDEVKNRCRAQE
ncbi:hypothetical protein J1N35_015858 [Gossypium stocksii]|uniref:Uncharacterized protein n=1 Tax=Gossypium stocksii TaxID=47602 RepID=A0A9D3VX35_9ROSI|nr:hypothetical protein J1N35_015858 [Gossypium stocksii]